MPTPRRSSDQDWKALGYYSIEAWRLVIMGNRQAFRDGRAQADPAHC